MFVKIRPEAKELICAALESGEYAQGKNKLAVKQEDGSVHYCCMGVMCEVAIKAGVPVPRVNDGGTFVYGKERNASVLPKEVRDWMGINEDHPAIAVADNGSSIFAATANDTLEWDFKKIAEAIRKNL